MPPHAARPRNRLALAVGMSLGRADPARRARSRRRLRPWAARAPSELAGPWPFAPGGFDGVVATNYLHRPLFPDLVGALRTGGVLICETFALGNERYGRPSNPAFLLRPDELLRSLEPLAVVAFEQGLVSAPKQAVIQRVCAVREGGGSVPLDAPAA